jgi:hypothetical protein
VEQISRGIAFQIAGAEAKVNAKWSGNKILLVGGVERVNRLVLVKK